MLKKVVSILSVFAIFITLIPNTSLAVERYEVLVIGDEDDWVYELQEKLNDLGYLQIPATGYFGTNTQNAVVEYQRDNGLVADGKAGPETRRSLLKSNYSEIPGTRTVTGTGATGSSSSGNTGETKNAATLYPGDKGDAISALQQRLKELEYYEYPSITGYYGPVTEDAVKKFQRAHGMEQNGILNESDSAILFSGSAKFYIMYPGDRGDDIKKMQERLGELGYFSVTATGYYGNATLQAVQGFQSSNGLSADGKAGQKTRSILYSDSAVPSKNGGSATSAPQPDSAAQPTPTPAPAATPSPQADPSSGVQTMINIANSQIGKPYSYGSSGPNSFDCSGFVYYVMKNSGIATSRLSSSTYASLPYWTTIGDMNSLAVGDLVFFKSDSSSAISHMGIYLGGGSFIHAAPSSGGVAISGMSSGYYMRNFVTAKRIY